MCARVHLEIDDYPYITHAVCIPIRHIYMVIYMCTIGTLLCGLDLECVLTRNVLDS